MYSNEIIEVFRMDAKKLPNPGNRMMAKGQAVTSRKKDTLGWSIYEMQLKRDKDQMGNEKWQRQINKCLLQPEDNKHTERRIGDQKGT